MKNLKDKIAMICAALLIFADFYTVVGIGSSNTDNMVFGAYILDYIHQNMLGLNALLGCAFFAMYFEKKSAKPLCIATLIVGAVNVVIRLVCVIIYIAQGVGFELAQSIELAEYISLLFMALSVVFLCLFMVGKKTMIITAATAGAAFICYFAQLIYSVSLLRTEAFTLLSIKEGIIMLSVCGIVIFVLCTRFNIAAVDKRKPVIYN